MEEAARRALRGAVARGDGLTVVTVLTNADPSAVLQLASDGLLLALAQDATGASGLAEDLGAALRKRGFMGDEQLATELEAGLGMRDPTVLRELPVNLEELSELLEENLGADGGRLDLATGAVWPASAIEYGQEQDDVEHDFDDETRFLYVGPEGSDEGYQDMADFAAMVAPDRADRLLTAIGGKGAFRRFRDTVARWPDDEERWCRFSDERRLGRARAWLADAGYKPATRSAPTSD
jgi:hypothetical protein